MTNEEAKEIMCKVTFYWELGEQTLTQNQINEALNMAIKALEQEPDTWSLEDAREDFVDDVYNTLDFLPTNDEANQIIDSFDRVTSSIRREPCEDCISKEAALNTLDYIDKVLNDDRTVERYKELLQECYEDLPSVTLSRSKGKWIHWTDDYKDYVTCSCCEYGEEGEVLLSDKTPFCPICGADMREREE